MAWVIEYEGGKKFIRDLKMRRRCRLTDRKRKEGEGEPKFIGAPLEKNKEGGSGLVL